MKTYELATLTKKVHDSAFEFFTTDTLREKFQISSDVTLFRVLHKLTQAGVLSKVERNKYVRTDYRGTDFALANFLYQPSYISFESALSFFGVLSQFPYEITSATLKQPRNKIWDEKYYSYTQVKKEIFWGYIKQEGYLIAEPEKALLDQIYLAGKGRKGLNLDEYDFSLLNKSKLKKYLALFPKTRQFMSKVRQLKEYL